MKQQILLSLLLLMTASLAKGQPVLSGSVSGMGDNYSLVTITADNGYMMDYLFRGKEEEVELDLYQPFDEAAAEESATDYLENTLWLPGPDGGVMPEDIIHNGASGKIYVFGNRRLAIINPTSGQILETHTVSDVGHTFLSTPLYYSTNHLAVDEVGNMVYCATHGTELVAINGVTGATGMLDVDHTVAQQLGTMLLFDPNFRRLFWIKVSWNGISRIKVFDLLNETSYEKDFAGQIFDAVLRPSGDKLFVNTLQSFIMLDPANLNVLNETSSARMILLFDPSTDEVIGHLFNDTKINFYSGSTGQYQSFVASPLYLAYAGVVKPQGSRRDAGKFYFSGIGGYSPHVVAFESVTHRLLNDITVPGNRVINALHYEPSNRMLYCSGDNIALVINGSTNQLDKTGDLAGCWSDKLIGHPMVPGNVISIHSFDGNLCTVTPECIPAGAFTQTGLSSFLGCYNPKDDKLYFVQSDANYERGVVSVHDGATYEHLNTMGIGQRMQDVVYNEVSNRVFISCLNDQVVAVIGGSDDTDVKIDLSGYGLFPKTLASYEDKIYVGAYGSWGNGGVVIIDAVTLGHEQVVSGMPGIPLDIATDEVNEQLYFVYGFENATILFSVNHRSGQYLTMMSFGNCGTLPAYPISAEYSSASDQVYVGFFKCGEVRVLNPADLTLVETISLPGSQKYMVYDPYRDYLYITGSTSDIIPPHYIAVIDCKTNDIINTISGSRNESLIFNPVNDQIYANTWYEPSPVGEVEVKTVDCLYNNIARAVGTGNYFNLWYSIVFRYSYSRQAYNPVSNRAFFTNNAFSNVSVIQCHTDRLKMKGPWNWISFPRLERKYNEPYNAIVALDQRVEPWPPGYLKMHYKTEHNYVEYIDPNWYGNELDEVSSTRGYKLYFQYGEESYSGNGLRLQGARLDPATEVALEGPVGNENWVGYFLEHPSWYWECIPADLLDQHIWEIKTQKWTMIRTCPPEMGECWLMDGSVRPFFYGDMIIIRTDQSTTFTWLTNGQGEGWEESGTLQHFTVEEKGDYVPFFIQFDAGSATREIAVLAGGVCRGASVRIPGDTLVEVNAYLSETLPRSTVEFRTWDGTQSVNIAGDGFRVFNPGNGMPERRRITAGEQVRYQLISLRKADIQ
ncbi:MAG: hypothetical protein JW861_01700 [Bacteroidales bacterium]|nr:hypothetical protein [Bacteroidales bacterium]